MHIFHIYGMKSLSQSEINFFVHLSAGSSSKIKKKKEQRKEGRYKKKNRKKQRNNKENMKT